MSDATGSSFLYTVLLFSVMLFLTQRKSLVLLSIIMPAILDTAVITMISYNTPPNKAPQEEPRQFIIFVYNKGGII